MNTGSALARFTITLSAAVTEPVQVEWHTSDGTAKASVDYAANKGTVVFAPGETAKTVDILVYGRAVGAEDRSFYVEMLPPTNAILGASIGECIIHVDTTGSTPVTQIIIPTGPQGIQGKSAYQSYVDTTTDNPPMTEPEWVESLKGDPEEIAQEVAPLIDVGDTTLISEGTDTLSKPDSTTVKAVARRIAYAAPAKIATVTLADGDNSVGQADMTGDTLDMSSETLYPRIMRGSSVITPEWSIQPDGDILVKNAVAGDVLYVCQYDFISGKKSNTNTRELWRRSLAEAGIDLVPGSFEEGATVNSKVDAVWYIAGGQCYSWDGAFPKAVPAGSTPVSTGGIGLGAWVSIGDATLRSDLASSADEKGDALISVKQPFTGAVPRTQHDKNAEIVSVKDFGAVAGNSDSTAAFQAALAYVASLGGGTVKVPSGSFLIKGTLDFTDNVHLVGAGQGSTKLVYSAINVPFAFIGTASTNINNVYIRDLHIIVEGTHTSGDLITWTNGYNLCLENVRVDGPFYTFLKMHGGSKQFIYRVNNCIINGATTSQDVIVIGDNSSAVVQDVFLQNLVLAGDGNGCGVKEVNASGVYASNIDCLGMKYGYTWLPSGTTKCRGSFYTAILGDTNKECGLMFAPTGGASISDLNFNGCWGSSCGTTSLHPGVHLNAENGGIENLNFNGLTCVNNKGSGLLVTGSSVGGINFSNLSCNANSMAISGQKHGIELGAGVQNMNFTNIKAGGTPVFGFNNQGYGIFISNGIGNGIKFVNVDARDNVNGAISNASDAAITIENCAQYVTYNTGVAIMASGTNSVTVATGISRTLQGRYVQVTPTTYINSPFWFEVSGQNIVIRVPTNVTGDQYFSWAVVAQR